MEVTTDEQRSTRNDPTLASDLKFQSLQVRLGLLRSNDGLVGFRSESVDLVLEFVHIVFQLSVF